MPVVVNYPPPSSVVVNEVTGAVTVVQSGKPGPQGIQGVPGVVTATSPATYDAPTQTVGVDETAIAIQPSQVAGTAVVQGDLPYHAVIPAIVQCTAVANLSQQSYISASIYNCWAITTQTQNCFLEWAVLVAAGTYTLRTAWRSGIDSAIVSISIDGGAALGTTIDQYAATAASNNVTDITSIVLTAGRHTIRYTGATKNASSTSFRIILHGFSLTRTGA
jgi:hypothetical protein